MGSQFLSILSIISAAQSFFLCFHFFFKSKGIKELNYLVSLVTFSFAIILLNTYFNLSETNFVPSIFQHIANHIMWFVSPALYLYVIYDGTLNKKTILMNTVPYVLPFILDVLFIWPEYSFYIRFIAYTQMCIYSFLSIMFCIKHYKNQKSFFSWVLPSLLVFTLIVIVNFILSLLLVNGIQLIPHNLQIGLVVLNAFPIFYISYKEMNSKESFNIYSKKYKATPISSKKSKEYISKILDALEQDKLYKDTNFKLATFSSQIDIPSKYISQTVNDALGVSFPELINRYRIEDVKLALLDSKNKHLTILGIAKESGFNSGSKFNDLFKKHTGLTPSAYQKKHY